MPIKVYVYTGERSRKDAQNTLWLTKKVLFSTGTFFKLKHLF